MNGPATASSSGFDEIGHYWICGECGHKNYTPIPWTDDLICEKCKTVNDVC
jgi:hypothetical protein